MSDLLNGYTQYLTFMEEIPLFNSESFVANKPTIQKKFFNDFSSTQIFRQFLQNDSKENFPYFYKIETQKKNSININARQSCFIPRTSSLDISKYIHLRTTSNNSISLNNKNINESFRTSDLSQNSIRYTESSIKINEKYSKEKYKSKFISCYK